MHSSMWNASMNRYTFLFHITHTPHRTHRNHKQKFILQFTHLLLRLNMKPNTKGFLIDLREGIRYKYPLCCILQFCFDTLLTRIDQRTLRHISGLGHVPCSLHLKAYGQTREIAKRQLERDTGFVLC